MAWSLAKPSLAFAIALAAWTSSPAGLRAQSIADPCEVKSGVTLDARIAACSARIESLSETPASRAEAFFQRGNAHYERKEWDQAIADLDDAITLAPGTASFHSARGRPVSRLTSPRCRRRG